MLKSPTPSAIFQSRKFVSTAARIPPPESPSNDIPAEPPPSRYRRRSLGASQRVTHRAATEKAQPPAGRVPKRPSMGYFPLGYKDAASQWWNQVTPTIAERNVIACIPHLRAAVTSNDDDMSKIPSAESPGSTQTSQTDDPWGPRIWKSTMVQLPGKNRALNEFSVERVGEEVDDNIVMLHGYGAGLGFYYKNFESLSRAKGWKLYALDMLGMGNSARPAFRIHAKDRNERIDEAEDWFIDALEDWRKVRKIEKFTLLGHSMGGYMAIAYALKYPGRLNKLILASPVGIPEDPYAMSADLPEPQESTFHEEITVDQNATTQSHGAPAGTLNAQSKQSASDAAGPKKRPYPGWLVWLWDANVSPFVFVRCTGPLGPRFVSAWSGRRFKHLPEDEQQTLHDYAYSLFRQTGSGEYALPYILAPGAHARRPMINRIQGVGRQTITPAGEGGTPAVKETGIPVVFMYGENDWMDVAGGLASEEKLKKVREEALQTGTEEEKRRENGSCKVLVVTKAGHHLYLDNADEFNGYIHKEMDETRAQTLRSKKEAAEAVAA